MNENWLENLLGEKREEFKIEKIHISDKSALEKLQFPIDFLTPLGTFNESYYEELQEKEELRDNKKVVNLIESKKLQESLKLKQLQFYVYYPTKSDIIEGYGAKFQEVEVNYKGFGLYHITIQNGVKKRSKKDRRWLEIDKDVLSPTEEIFIAFDTEIDGYRRVHKNTFQSLIQEFKVLKYIPEIEELIVSYKKFFKDVVLSPISHQQKYILGDKRKDTLLGYKQYAEYFLEHITLMKDYYLYHSIVGNLKENSYKLIQEQIDRIEAASKNVVSYIYGELTEDINTTIEMIYERDVVLELHQTLWNTLSDTFSEKYWLDVTSGNFYENMKTFYLKYVTTDEFEDDALEEKKKLATAIRIVFDEYYNLREEKIASNTFNYSGIFYTTLERTNSIQQLDKVINERKPILERIFEDDVKKKKYPEIAQMGYLFQFLDE